MKIIYRILIGCVFYLLVMLFSVYSNKYFSYGDIDHDHNGLVTPGELSYYSNVGTLVTCNDDYYSSKKCVCEVFSLKDGLTLTILPVNICP